MTTRNSVTFKTAPFIGVGCIIGYLLATILPVMTHDAAHAAPGTTSRDQRGQSAAGATNVVVSYKYETSANSTSGNNALAARAIEFHPSYVLVRGSNGTTTLLAVDRLRSFSYRPADVK